MKKALCWLRRDLRLHDHHALSEALRENDETVVCFIFDSAILDKLKDKSDRRVTFIHESLIEIEKICQQNGSSLIIRYGDPIEEIPKLLKEFSCNGLYYNRDYEPYAKKRDQMVEKILNSNKVSVNNYKDHVFFEKHEILNGTGTVYKVFTPYKNKWLDTFRNHEETVQEYKCKLSKLAKLTNSKNIINHDWMKEINFNQNDNLIKGGTGEALKKLKTFQQFISNYKVARDFPHLNQTSLLSTYIRMGNISIRDMIRASLMSNGVGPETWLSELIWRDFYQMILDVYPKTENQCFRPEYDALNWRGSEAEFKLWCEGLTGYPLVDAAMRCLNETGFMHNRLRMVVASFLTKTLLVDWKKGERYFAAKLFDYDLAANTGGWQWSASTGVDAQPYFRIFNPYNQSEKFDPDGQFIRLWCPELAGFSSKEIHAPQDTDFPAQDRAACFIGRDYPQPIVSYTVQRDRALKMFKEVKG